MKNNTADADIIERARKFHETYERLAPQFGYETRADTREFDPESPNGKLMIAVVSELARQSRWVTCEERLPKPGPQYWVTVRSDNGMVDTDTAFFTAQLGWYMDCEVVAWMPLPEPYQEPAQEEQNDE